MDRQNRQRRCVGIGTFPPETVVTASIDFGVLVVQTLTVKLSHGRLVGNEENAFRPIFPAAGEEFCRVRSN